MGDFASPRGRMVMPGNIVATGDDAGIYCAEARDAAKHPTRCSISLTTKKYPV